MRMAGIKMSEILTRTKSWRKRDRYGGDGASSPYEDHAGTARTAAILMNAIPVRVLVEEDAWQPTGSIDFDATSILIRALHRVHSRHLARRCARGLRLERLRDHSLDCYKLEKLEARASAALQLGLRIIVSSNDERRIAITARARYLSLRILVSRYKGFAWTIKVWRHYALGDLRIAKRNHGSVS